MGKIILLIGLRGSGKDYYSNQLVEEIPHSHKIGFSDGVRDYSWKALGWEPVTPEEYDAFKQAEVKIEFKSGFVYKITGREFLLNVGDKQMKSLDPNIWAKIWGKKCEAIFNENIESTVIGYDLRYVQEYAEALRIKKLYNAELKVEFCNFKSNRWELSNHPSEALAKFLFLQGFGDKANVTDFIKNLDYNEWGEL